MRISDWSSDVCSSDLAGCGWRGNWAAHYLHGDPMADHFIQGSFAFTCSIAEAALIEEAWQLAADLMGDFDPAPISDELLAVFPPSLADKPLSRSEEHTSELQSLMRTSYAVFCLKKK